MARSEGETSVQEKWERISWSLRGGEGRTVSPAVLVVASAKSQKSSSEMSVAEVSPSSTPEKMGDEMVLDEEMDSLSFVLAATRCSMTFSRRAWETLRSCAKAHSAGES